MDASDVGKYGTLRVLKRLDDEIVACYPIDEEEVTIGRDPSCNLRLYYDSVSSIHCKLIFRERKAFLMVLGTNGLLVDGCAVFPASNPSSGPVIVPLPNSSVIEIHKKRFQFCYPPKEMRPILLSTPSKVEAGSGTPRQRKLRLSMIQSAQVFSPRPSPNPRENLRILQTPIKTPFRGSNVRDSSPLKRGAFIQDPEEEDEEEEEEEEDILLVETNHPRVVEEDEDLVITEHVVFQPPPPQPDTPKSTQSGRVAQFPIPQPAQPSPQMQQTPRRRPHPRASLHRAVLIRSAQRTAMRREMEREEEEEVEEVEETINDLIEEEEEEDQENEPMQVDEYDQSRSTPRVSGWRKGLEAVKGGLGWALGSPSVPQDIQGEWDQDDEQDQDAMEVQDDEELIPPGEEHDAQELFEFYDSAASQQEPDEDEDEESPEQPVPSSSSVSFPTPHFESAAPAPPLGRFMSPQLTRVSSNERDHGRYSMGPGAATIGPRRVKIVEPWKVEDIVVPVKQEEKPEEHLISPRKQRLTEEEKRAIQERRRSALTMPDNFTPGTKRLLGLSPIKAAPLPALNLGTNGRESSTIPEQPEETEEDTEIMLAKMKQMVEGVKRRQSMGPRPSMVLSPKKPGEFSLLASTPGPSSVAGSAGKATNLDKNPFADDADDLDLADVEMSSSEQDRSTAQLPTRQPALFATPQLTGVRELFRNQGRAIQTPRLDGMKELFRVERPPQTPAFEGVGSMLATPAGYQAPSQPEPTEEMEMEVEVLEERPQKTIQSRLKKPAASGSRIPATRRGAVPRSAPARAPSRTGVEEEAPVEPSTSKIPSTAAKVTRKPRSKGLEIEKPPSATGSSSRTKVTAETDNDHRRANSAPNPPPIDEPEVDDEPEEPSKPPSKVTRRGRKAAETPPPEEPAPTRTLRKTRTARTPVPESASTSEPPKSTIRRGTRARPITVEEEQENAAPRDPSPDKEVSGAKVRRSARTKVKEEEVEDSPLPEASSEPSKGSRGRKAAATTKLPTSKSTGRSKASASSKKVVVEESLEEVGDKENTPEGAEEEEVVPLTKPKSTRKTRRAATEEREEAPAETGKTRVSRSKTGTRR